MSEPAAPGFQRGWPHFCLNNNLTRLELRVLFEQLALRMPALQLDGPVEYLPSNWAHSMTSMPVTFASGTREEDQ